MDVSISTVAYDDMTLTDQLRLISQAGFHYVNLMASDLWEFHVSHGMQKGLSILLEILESNNLKVDWIHLPYQTTDLLTTNREKRIVQQSAFCNLVDMAGKLGARVAVFHPFGETSMSFSGDVNEAGQRIISFLEPIIDIAESFDVQLALENAQIIAADNAPLHQMIEIALEQLTSLCICLDRGHAEVSQEMDFYFPRYAERVVALHVHDNLGFQDEHRFPGEGMIDWPAFAKLLKQSNYKGIFGLEVVAENTTFSHLQPEEWFAEAYRRACLSTKGMQPPGPNLDKYPYMPRCYDLKHSDKFFNFGTLEENANRKSELCLELASGLDWDNKPFGDTPPLVSDSTVSAEAPFMLFTKIDVTTFVRLKVSCVVQTENVHGIQPWESAAIFVIPFDHNGQMIGFSSLAMVTGTKTVEMNRSLQLNPKLVGHVELWIRKMADTTGSCKFSNLKVLVQPIYKSRH